MANVIIIPLVIPSAKTYYIMSRLRLNKDERTLFHGCCVIVVLLKKQGMKRTYEKIIVADIIIIPLVIPSVKAYYIMSRLSLKEDKRTPSHGCGVIVVLLKKQGMGRTYLWHMIKALFHLFPWQIFEAHIDKSLLPHESHVLWRMRRTW